jgi:hypothetical protein
VVGGGRVSQLAGKTCTFCWVLALSALNGKGDFISPIELCFAIMLFVAIKRAFVTLEVGIKHGRKNLGLAGLNDTIESTRECNDE